jgi:hypothetical protein
MSEMNNQEQDQEKRMRDRMSRKPQLPRSPSGFMWIYIILIVGLIGFFVPGMMSEVPKIDYTEFNALVRHHAIKKIYRVSNQNNRLEIVLFSEKDKAGITKDSAVKALMDKFASKG